MSTVKISQLPLISTINSNTSNTLFAGVDIPTGVTGKMTAHTLAQGLYSNEILNVGVNQQNLPNTVAQFTLSGQSYIQTNLVNTNDGGTADIVVTANVGSGGTDSTYFTDLGFANKNVVPGLEFNNLGTALSPLDGYLYVQGAAVGGPAAAGGNLLIGTTSTNTEVKIIAGGYNSDNVVAKFTGDGFKMLNGHPIYFTDGTTQNTAAASNAYSIAAYTQANTANVLARSAYNQANTSLQNTTTITANSNLIIPGALTVTGNVVSQNGYVQFNNSTFNTSNAFIQITASNNFSVVAPSNTNYMMQITGKANSVTRVVIDSFGQNTYPLVAGRMGRGSAGVPAAVQANDVMMRIVGNGYTGTQFPASSPTKIDFIASENFSDTNRGTQIQFWNTPTGSNTLTQIASFNAIQANFFGYVNPQKGFVYTPNIYPGAQTAITLDFANNVLVRAQTSTGLVATLSNLLAGKEVVLWVTNTATSPQTFTHGVSALNSTVNSTTQSIPATSTILARYMSMDGTLANTLVAITKA